MIYFRGLKLILTGLLFPYLSFFNTLYSTDNPEISFNKIFYLIYNQQYDEAYTELIQTGKEFDEWNYKILNLDLYWWQAISNNSENDFARFESILKDYSTEFENTQNCDRLEELIILSYSFRLSSLRNRFLSMFKNLYKIGNVVGQIDLIQLTKEQQDIYRIYLALYKIIKSKLLLNNPGLRKEGISVLEDNSDSLNPVYKTISNYLLSKIYLELDKQPGKALDYCEQLCKIYPGNKIFAHNLEICKKKMINLSSKNCKKN